MVVQDTSDAHSSELSSPSFSYPDIDESKDFQFGQTNQAGTAVAKTHSIACVNPCKNVATSTKFGLIGAAIAMSLAGLTIVGITLLAKKISQLRASSCEMKLQAQEMLRANPDISYMDNIICMRESYQGWAQIRARQGLVSSWESFILEGQTPLYELRSTWTTVAVPTYSFRSGWDVGIAIVPDSRYVCVWSGLDVNRTIANIAGRHGRSFTEVLAVCYDSQAYSHLFSIFGPSYNLYNNLLRGASSASTRAVMAGVFGIGGVTIVGGAAAVVAAAGTCCYTSCSRAAESFADT